MVCFLSTLTDRSRSLIHRLQSILLFVLRFPPYQISCWTMTYWMPLYLHFPAFPLPRTHLQECILQQVICKPRREDILLPTAFFLLSR
ncbi:hypothetical protein MUK42_34816 [Musa troglodytarum]|uniref:Uncharacterized protein n=1 Tax=Musa troglodytarum TaxID=320322 RepID=A0A9E7HNX6_9LILI|nr:hypothetical protein MUK42_34816 [Musa troglodytarum]URE37966.1 hypothetical protein MUK42_34816 [Musa troglodytarum]URE37967.1 hypothetical protein MUK42_34816 [Musa troglodytarum]URE37971.1 hypothetical protein MUK42_34816 [Musa troglodytarum]